MPRVSVLLPSYNHEKYICECIKSVLNQTYQDFEFIIVDDGSSDNTVNEIKKFNDKRIKLFCFERNHGACVAMNKCINEMQGEYAAVINSDDIFMPDKLEKQVKFLDEHKEYGAVFSYAKIIDEDGNELTDKDYYNSVFKQINRSRFEWLNKLFYDGNCLCHPSVMIKKECYERIGKFNNSFALDPDYDYWIRLCMKYDIYVISEELIKYRVRNNSENVSALKPEIIIRSSWETYEILKNYLNIKNPEELYKIFPQLCNEQIENDSIPYFIAKLALNVENRNYKAFSIHVLYNLMNDEKIAKKIKEKYNFRYTDLIDLSGKIDAFNFLNDDKSKLFVDNGAGFNEELSISEKVYIYSKNFNVSFDLSSYNNIKSIRWDPIEGKFCSVKILSAIYEDIAGEKHQIDLENIITNGQLMSNGSIKFETFDPYIVFQVQGNIVSVSINGYWKFLDNTEVEKQYISVLREKVDSTSIELQKSNNEILKLEAELLEKKNIISELNTKIENDLEYADYLQAEVNKRDTIIGAIYNSRAWKVIDKYRKIKYKIKSKMNKVRSLVSKVKQKFRYAYEISLFPIWDKKNREWKSEINIVKFICEIFNFFKSKISFTKKIFYDVRIKGEILKQRPKIIHAIPNTFVGGSTQLIVDLIEYLGHKYDMEIVTYSLPKDGKIKGITIHDLSKVQSEKDVSEFLKQKKCDILHVHYWGDIDTPWYTKIFESTNFYKCKVIENINTPVKPYISDNINRYVYVSEYAQKMFGEYPNNSTVVYPGSDFTHFQSKVSKVRKDAVGMVYRLEPDKLNEESIDVFIELAKRRPQTLIYIVGFGSYFNLYVDKAYKANVRQNFVFTGYVSYDKLPEIYDKFSIFVAPVWKESFGQVSPFAMSKEMVVTGYDVGALSEILNGNETLGENKEQLVDKVIYYLDNYDVLCEKGKEFKNRAQQHFSVEAMISRYDEVYSEILKDE